MAVSKPLALMISVSALALAGCATADLRPGIVRHETPKQIRAKFHGPEVRIRANVVSTERSRMIEPVVALGDSAYLVIGDIGDDGTLRIIYPARPGEPNLVRQKGSFQGPLFQPRIVLPWVIRTYTAARTAPGHAFVIASSSPLDLTKLAEGDRWSVFDVYYENHENDPRPAITDLAAAIATNIGDVSISYTPYTWGFIGSRPISTRAAPQATQPTTDGRGRRPTTRPPG